MILNLTQHQATPEQTAAGVVDLPSGLQDYLRELLAFDCITETQHDDMAGRARDVVQIINDFETDDVIDKALIGGAPFFTSYLEAALRAIAVQPVYAFSKRDVVETATEDGRITKTTVFRHQGFVPAMDLPVHAG